MKVLNHPNIVNLIEVIDDPTTDHFYMGTPVFFIFHYLPISYPSKRLNSTFCNGTKPLHPIYHSWKRENKIFNLFFQLSCSVLEYVEGKWVCEGAGPPGGIGVNTARRYLRDIVSGLIYLHAHVWHKDIYLFIQHILYPENLFF